MQTVIAPPALTGKPRLADPLFVAKKFTWKHPVEQLLNVILPKKKEVIKLTIQIFNQ